MGIHIEDIQPEYIDSLSLDVIYDRPGEDAYAGGLTVDTVRGYLHWEPRGDIPGKLRSVTFEQFTSFMEREGRIL